MENDTLAAEFIKEPGPLTDVHADYLITGRLVAWSRILLRDREPTGIFVTHSAAVLEHLLDHVPAAEKILDLKALPRSTPTAAELAPWQEQLMSYLSDIVLNKWSPASGQAAERFDIPAAENTVSLKIYLVPDQNSSQFFCRGAGINDPESDLKRPTPKGKNTLLGLVEPSAGRFSR